MSSALASLSGSSYGLISGLMKLCSSPESNQKVLHSGQPSNSMGSKSVPFILLKTIFLTLIFESQHGQSKSTSLQSDSNALCIAFSFLSVNELEAASAFSSIPEHSGQLKMPWSENAERLESVGPHKGALSLGQKYELDLSGIQPMEWG